MDKEKSRKIAVACNEYVEALNKYNKLVDKYVKVQIEVPGEILKLEGGWIISEESIRELEEAEAEVKKKRERWYKLIVC